MFCVFWHKTVADMKSEDGNSHVFISYNWENQPMVLQIKDHLKSAGYNVWLDVEQMSMKGVLIRLKKCVSCQFFSEIDAGGDGVMV